MTGQELFTIEASVREKAGKGCARKLRRSGKVPAVVLEKGKSTSIEFNPKLLSKIWQSGKKFNLTLNGKTSPVVIKELQIDPVKRTVLHVDLMPSD